MRRIGRRAVVTVALAVASLAVWNGLASAGSSPAGGTSNETGSSVSTEDSSTSLDRIARRPGRFVPAQAQEDESPPDGNSGRRPCPKDRQGGDAEGSSTESTSV
jgi:hypothetical protein